MTSVPPEGVSATSNSILGSARGLPDLRPDLSDEIPSARTSLRWNDRPREDASHARGDREHVPDPRRRPPGAGRTRRGRQRWLRTRRLVGHLLGRHDEPGDGGVDERPVRPAPGAYHVRHLRLLLAERAGGTRREAD